jgi:hypothetical protein
MVGPGTGTIDPFSGVGRRDSAFGQGLEFMSRNQFHDLGEYGIVMSQDQISYLFYNVFSLNSLYHETVGI